MHGQKKRRKRTIGGLVVVDDHRLQWFLLSEPQKAPRVRSHRSLRITVRSEGERHRELILEYPFPDKHTGNGAFQIQQRPKFSVKTVESDVRRAIASGWDPLSRGKALVYRTS